MAKQVKQEKSLREIFASGSAPALEFTSLDKKIHVVGASREFSTGSFGWNINQKIMVEVDGRMVSASFNGNIIVSGSKDM